ncbi:hypothetical protein BJ138DRAFT_1149154 [Hygrophoropsis aurantiaca]|uniref:Uncharacterized protein n=1 Tax=Hygrophoropsis aurantiaca TaxID=72124 RepID=A0ACB8AFU2_9AGAM|nr:hypothetical protein BJ138DRAFT_1149154 [Hygrophoropsis aurantiaca]
MTASWIDFFSLLTTTVFFVGAVLGVIYIAKQITAAIQSTKATLEEKGIAISDKGVSVKTSRRLERDDYVDATQRGFVKAFNASTFGPGGAADEKSHLTSKSSTSLNGDSKEKKSFGIRRVHSNTHAK